MKRIDMLMLFLLLSISSYAFDNKLTAKIEFTITDKHITNNSFITLLIKNRTTSNYYLPVIGIAETEKLNLILPFEEKTFFFLTPYFSDNSKNEVPWFTQDCNNFEIMDELEQLWKQKKKKIDVKDLILLKSGESITIKIPVNLSVKISEDCTWRIKDSENNNGLNVSII